MLCRFSGCDVPALLRNSLQPSSTPRSRRGSLVFLGALWRGDPAAAEKKGLCKRLEPAHPGAGTRLGVTRKQRERSGRVQCCCAGRAAELRMQSPRGPEEEDSWAQPNSLERKDEGSPIPSCGSHAPATSSCLCSPFWEEREGKERKGFPETVVIPRHPNSCRGVGRLVLVGSKGRLVSFPAKGRKRERGEKTSDSQRSL